MIYQGRRGPKSKHKESATELGRVIQDARKKKGLTTLELGELVGVSDASVTQTESGETLPRKPTIVSYEKHLGVSLIPLWEVEIAKRKELKTQSLGKAYAVKATKQQPLTVSQETLDNLSAALAGEGRVSPDDSEKLRRGVKKRGPEILKEKTRRERKTRRGKKGGK